MIGFYSFNNSIYANYRVQKNGRSVSLKYFPGIRDTGWNKATRRFKDDELNTKILNIEKAIIEIVKNKDPLTLNSKSFSELINEQLTGPRKKQTSFFDYCDQFFNDKVDSVGYNRSKSIQTTIRKLRVFKSNLTFEEITDKFSRDFVKFLRSKGYAENYVSKHISNLKRIMTQATRDKMNTCLDFHDFKKKNEEVFNVFLTEPEIEKIYNLKFELSGDNREDYARYITIPNSLMFPNLKTKEPNLTDRQISHNLAVKINALERSRKLFVIGCWTGLRCENYLNIDPDVQIDETGKFIQAIANKNGPKVLIPIHRIVSEIIADGWPVTITGQKLNEHVKTLGFMAGLNEKVMWTRTEGGSRITHINAKWEMLSSHSARRSFATNLFLRGVPSDFIRAVTGHKSDKEFNKYIKAAPEQISRMLANYDVWK